MKTSQNKQILGLVAVFGVLVVAAIAAPLFVFGSGNFNVSFKETGLVSKNDNCFTANEVAGRYIDYDLTATNGSDHPYKIAYLAFHSDTAGCAAYNATLSPGYTKVSGKDTFAPGESGNLKLQYDMQAFNCGRVQYDAGFFATDLPYDSTVFIGVVVDYGVNCPTSTPTPVPAPCVDDATAAFINTAITQGIPDSVTAGKTVPFTVHVTNTGNTKWYHGLVYKFAQKSNLTLSPDHGHLPSVMHVGDATDWSFTLTAPTTPGTYTLSMQMVHTNYLNAEYIREDGSVCPGSGQDMYFGQTVTKTFTVVGSTPTPTPTQTPTPTFVPTPTPAVQQCAVGTVIINSNNANESYSLIGPNGSVNANGNHTFTNQATGNYSINLNNSNNNIVIAPTTNILACNSTVIFNIVVVMPTATTVPTSTPIVTATPTPVVSVTPTPAVQQCAVGTVIVNSNNANNSYSLIGPGGSVNANGNHTFTNQATGNYSINLTNSNNSVVVAPTTNVLACNSTVVFNIVTGGVIAGALHVKTGPSDYAMLIALAAALGAAGFYAYRKGLFSAAQLA